MSVKGTRNTGRDLTGKIFDRLTVVRLIRTDKRGTRHWLCECVCGNETSGTTGNLTNGTKKSCGCLIKSRAGQKEWNQGAMR